MANPMLSPNRGLQVNAVKLPADAASAPNGHEAVRQVVTVDLAGVLVQDEANGTPNTRTARSPVHNCDRRSSPVAHWRMDMHYNSRAGLGQTLVLMTVRGVRSVALYFVCPSAVRAARIVESGFYKGKSVLVLDRPPKFDGHAAADGAAVVCIGVPPDFAINAFPLVGGPNGERHRRVPGWLLNQFSRALWP